MSVFDSDPDNPTTSATLKELASALNPAVDHSSLFHKFVQKTIEPEAEEEVECDLSFSNATLEEIQAIRNVKPLELAAIYFDKFERPRYKAKVESAKKELEKKIDVMFRGAIKKRITYLTSVIENKDEYVATNTGSIYRRYKSIDKIQKSIPKLPKCIRTNRDGMIYLVPDLFVEALEGFITELESGDLSSFHDLRVKKQAILNRTLRKHNDKLAVSMNNARARLSKKLNINITPIQFRDAWYAPSDLHNYVQGELKFEELKPFDFLTQFIDNKARARYRHDRSYVNKQVTEHKVMTTIRQSNKIVRKFDCANQRKWLNTYKSTLNVSAACTACGISRAHFYKFVNDEANKAFSFAFHSLRDDLVMRVENKFLDTVLNGSVETKYDGDDKVVSKTIKDAPPALLLRALDNLSETYKRLPEMNEVNVTVKSDNRQLIDLAAALGVTLTDGDLSDYMKEKEVKGVTFDNEAEDANYVDAIDLSDGESYLDMATNYSDDPVVASRMLLDSLDDIEGDTND